MKNCLIGYLKKFVIEGIQKNLLLLISEEFTNYSAKFNYDR